MMRLVIVCAAAWQVAVALVAPASPVLGAKRQRTAVSVFDVAVAETVASAAALPAVMVGTGSFLLLGEEEEEKEEEVVASPDGEVDIYRDTALRYASFHGYLNIVEQHPGKFYPKKKLDGVPGSKKMLPSST